MNQLSNQFAQSVVKGMPDLRLSPNVISCEVHSSQSVALVPGQAVKLYDVAGGAPKVVAVTGDTDLVFGYISYNQKQATFAAGEALEISLDGGVLYLEASAAVARQAFIMPVVTGSKVATATSGKPISGVALDKADADGDLIRVFIKSFGMETADAGGSDQYEAEGTIATADVKTLNATPVALIAAPAAGKFHVVDHVELFMDFATTAYDGVAAGEDLSLAYETAGEISRLETTGFLDQGDDQRRLLKVGSPAGAPASGPLGVAEAVQLSMLVGEIATGDSPIKWKIYYRTLTALV